METSNNILTDLKAVLLENHRDFSFLNLYKGVPLVCRARLDRVEGSAAYYTVQPPESVALKAEQTTLVLSDGLLEPLEAKVECVDLATGEYCLKEFTYAGSKFANRRELRVEPAGRLKVDIVSDGRSAAGEIADISVRGLGVNVPQQEQSTLFIQGLTVGITLHLPKNEVRLEGKIRNVSRKPESARLAIEFTGTVPEKAIIIRYVMQRRSEIVSEVRTLYEQEIRLKEPPEE
jgi:hypothetical protein